jgi:hypothetical protein
MNNLAATLLGADFSRVIFILARAEGNSKTERAELHKLTFSATSDHMDDSASVAPSYNGVKTEQRYSRRPRMAQAAFAVKRAHPRFSVFAKAEATLRDGTLVPEQVF